MPSGPPVSDRNSSSGRPARPVEDACNSCKPRDSCGRRRQLRSPPSSQCFVLAACLLPAVAQAFALSCRTGGLGLAASQQRVEHSSAKMARQSAVAVALPPKGSRPRVCGWSGMGVERARNAGGKRYHRRQTSMLSSLHPMKSAVTATTVAATAAAASAVNRVSLRCSAVSRLREVPDADVDPRNVLVVDANPDDAVSAGSHHCNGKGGDILPRKIVAGACKRIRALHRSVVSVTAGTAAAAVKGAKPSGATAQQRPFLRRRSAGVALISAAVLVLLEGGWRGRPALAAALVTSSAWSGKGASFAAMIPSAGLNGAPAAGASATAAAAVGGAQMSLGSVAPRLALWFTLFVTSAAFHSAEIAITTLYPWKVREFAEEEGESSPFQVLNKDITRVLTTILVATTVCTIYNAALFTNLAIQLFGSAGLAYATAALTVTTLFFGELLPKALGVNNAEVVARRVLPVIIVLSTVLNPIAQSFTLVSKLMLSMLGLKSNETGRVSEEELRLIVTGAKMSGGIESQEGMMIEGVLDLQDTKISEIMRPRVEVVAIEANSTMMDLYQLHQETKYSRIPVYSGEIDRISGVVLSKDLLDFVQEPEKLSSVLVADETESTYFVPETMSVWNVLEEMRKRRLHMAIVVDEYGGTAGVVTLEDILEEVVGEIYDETEDDELREEEHYINLNEDGSFTIHGMADLEDVCTSLAFREVSEDDLKEFGTLSGYLCSQAGEIPAVGDYVMVGDYMFTVTKADKRRIEEVHAKLLGGTQKDAASGGRSEGAPPGSGGGVGVDHVGNGGSKQDKAEGAVVSGDFSPPASSTARDPSR